MFARRLAFTLVELLVVIGIIAVLVGILLPVLSRARQYSATVKCASNMRQWSAAVLLYANQEQGWLPRRGQGAQATTVFNRPSDWFNALPPLMKQTSLVDLIAAGRPPKPGDGTLWSCPSSVENGQVGYFTYAMNMRLSTWNALMPDRINRIGSWTTVVFLAEVREITARFFPPNAKYSPVARHREKLNVAYLDGPCCNVHQRRSRLWAWAIRSAPISAGSSPIPPGPDRVAGRDRTSTNRRGARILT